MPWLTGDTISAASKCRAVLIPDDQWIIAAVSGALLDLTRPENWELHGTVTPEQISDAMVTMFYGFLDSVCASGGDMEFIAMAEVSSPVAYLEFTSIPDTYESLLLKTILRSDQNGVLDGANIQFNADTGNNYRYGTSQIIHTTGFSTHSAARNVASIFIQRAATGALSLANDFNIADITIENYARIAQHPIVKVRAATLNDASAASDNQSVVGMGAWNNPNDDITTIRVSPNGGTNWTARSRIVLYGLKGS